MASAQAIQAMTERQATSRNSIIVQLLRLLLGLWDGFDRWDDAETVVGMAARSATLGDSANLQSRQLTRTFQTNVLRGIDAGKGQMPALVNAYPRQNTNGTEVFQRPVEQFIWARRNGLSFLDSKAAFEQRLTDVATQDVKLADRDEANRIFEADPDVDRWRRVIHPELSRSGTCGLCLAASQQVYTVGDLMPMHGPSCNCTVMGITAGHDPGLRITQDDLKSIYAAAGSTAADDLVNTRFTINEHGELGPVMVKHGDHFRSAAEAGRPAYVKPTNNTIRASRQGERADLVTALADAQTRYDVMTQDDNARVPLFRSMKYMRERITQIDTFLSTLPQ